MGYSSSTTLWVPLLPSKKKETKPTVHSRSQNLDLNWPSLPLIHLMKLDWIKMQFMQDCVEFICLKHVFLLHSCPSFRCAEILNLLKIEVWKKVVWFHEFRFLVQNLAESWHKQHESIPPCIGGSLWWWCNGVGIFFCHTLVPLIPTEHHLIIISSIIHLFMDFSHCTQTCHLQRFSDDCGGWMHQWEWCDRVPGFSGLLCHVVQQKPRK